MNDVLTVALAAEANPAEYALLLGSRFIHISRVPTRWGIIQPLIARIATIDRFARL
jgi:hypothetical protein